MPFASTVATGIIAGVIYDVLKVSGSFVWDQVRAKLPKTISLNDTQEKELPVLLEKLDLNSDMSESAIQRKIENSSEIMALIQSIQVSPQIQNTITQNHSGEGDNNITINN